MLKLSNGIGSSDWWAKDGIRNHRYIHAARLARVAMLGCASYRLVGETPMGTEKGRALSDRACRLASAPKHNVTVSEVSLPEDTYDVRKDRNAGKPGHLILKRV
jgi:hypothetical protein